MSSVKDQALVQALALPAASTALTLQLYTPSASVGQVVDDTFTPVLLTSGEVKSALLSTSTAYFTDVASVTSVQSSHGVVSVVLLLSAQ